MFFQFNISQLESKIKNLEVEWEDQDQLNSIDFENYLLTNKICFSVFTDDEINLYWQLIEVSSKVETVSDKLIYCVADDVELMAYNAGEFVLVFAKEWNREMASELVSSLL